MKTLRVLLVATSLATVLTLSARAADADPGFVDIGQLVPSANGKFVEVNLSPAMLKFAAKLAAREEPQAAALIGNLKHVRVNVVGLDDSNRKSTLDRMAAIRASLESKGWTQMVTVREKNDSNHVDIHVRQRADEVIEGLVITVINEEGEAVFVNVVGEITADQIGRLADDLNIEPLKHVHLKGERRAKNDDEA